jgi:ABC-type lipoprotein export system ATPase subunit
VAGPIVELEGVEKEYGTGASPLAVLRGIDLTIEAGEFVAIVGASGSGKTTLMNLLGLLDHPTRGRYALAGEDVAGFDDDRRSRMRGRAIGFVFQSFHLIPELSVLENVELAGFYQRQPRKQRRARSLELLSAVGLAARLHHRPSMLSGGECQRVAVARALFPSPALLLADEPTGNLDTHSGSDVLGLFRGLHESGHTIVMVTHNAEIAAAMPRRVEMSDGRVVSDQRASARV